MTDVRRAAVAAGLLLALAAGPVLAHPLGNFTVNQSATIRVEPDRVRLDLVVDAAEIPTFQAVVALDRDGDGTLTGEAADGLAVDRCLAAGRAMVLSLDGAALRLRLTAAGVRFPAGNGNLPTMRLACSFEADATIEDGSTFAFRNGHEAGRTGWHEVIVTASGTTVDARGLPSVSPSARLTDYPDSLASAPDVREAAVTARQGGPLRSPEPLAGALPVGPIDVDAGPAVVPSGSTAAGPAGDDPAGGPAAAAPPGMAGAVPGGAEAVPDLLRSAPTSPLLALLALLVAAGLGAGHALTPGHGKTLVAAYLVGTRGGARQAVGLGLSVAVAHTAGILVLALVVVAFERTLPSDLVLRAAPVVAAVSIVVVGTWMLLAEVRRVRAGATRVDHDLDPDHGHDHAHDHGHNHVMGSHSHRSRADGHGWRGLALLGLAGGLVPSASALLLLLGGIAAGRPAWGLLLVLAFGAGMAGVMTGIGLGLVLARHRLERLAGRLLLAGLARRLPLATAVLVLAVGVLLTGQALVSVRAG